MSLLAPTLQAFFTDRLIGQRQASGHTIAAYSDTFRLLLRFVEHETGKTPASLDIDDLNVSCVGRFLDHLEHERANSVTTRNARLAAIRSFFRFAALRHPEHAATIGRVLAIPAKRRDRTVVSFLTVEEVDALLAAPDRATWVGRRDHTLLAVAVQTGLRVSELTGLDCRDVVLGRGAHVRCTGKGRKERCTPLTAVSVSLVGAWLRERRGGPDDPLFTTSRGRRLSRDAVALLVSKYTASARKHCPTLVNKTVSPHTLRHTAAMRLVEAGVEATVVALWMGHESPESTQPYIHADLGIKERAMDRTASPKTKPGRYRPDDALIAFLEAV